MPFVRYGPAIRTDKHKKPYVICDHCGVQLFVRKKAGIVQLEKLLQNLRTQDFQFAKHKESFLQVCAVLHEIDDLRREIRKLESKIGFFYDDPATERAIEALTARIKCVVISARKTRGKRTANCGMNSRELIMKNGLRDLLTPEQVASPTRDIRWRRSRNGALRERGIPYLSWALQCVRS